MKQNRLQHNDPRYQLALLREQMEITEQKMNFVTDVRLHDALSYELLGLKARIGYVINAAKNC